jgi:putative aldouronate transport system permease protein
MNAYGITTLVTFVGTTVSIFICSMIAYVLSQRGFKFRSAVTFFIFFTMLFNGGVVPWYILIRNYLNLENTVWALILPSLVSPYYILILRTFFSKIPDSLVESAKLDGAKDFYIYSSIILPLSKPALATVGLFTALGYWNDWWHCLMFIDKYNMNSLQYLLQRIMRNIDYLYTAINTGVITIKMSDLPTESMRMAMVIMAAGPMLFLLTFLQKYFVKGLTIGAIKG